ncbi:MAG: sulfite exporter TauE/SafE family protein [Actinomycetia bacterium]|nr:sulfite exporter TauE/SafE family protein [Actinomycetes bacterium]
MIALLLIALAGAGAQLVDGSLGMGYGVTSASLLLALGTAPALASASVNVAQIATTFISGASHHRFGNVDWSIVRRLSVPGAVGGIAGATFLSGLSTQAARPLMAVLLFTLAIGIIVRFTVGGKPGTGRLALLSGRRGFLAPLGLVGGFVNATGGGGWGPVVTSTLISTSPVAPRRVIGSVSASEFVVTVAASVGFLVGLGFTGIDLRIVAALMAGGVVAAPVAARLAGLLPAPVLGVCVGGLILLLNVAPVLTFAGIDGVPARAIEGVLAAAWLAVLTRAISRVRAERGAESDSSDPVEPSAFTGPAESAGRPTEVVP